MTSKQAVHSPAKGDAYAKVNVTSIKFNNQYVSDIKRQSVKEPNTGAPLANSVLGDQHPQKFA